MIRAVLFDMDGLLLDTEPLWSTTMHQVANKHNIPVTPERFKETTGLRIYEVTEHWATHFPWQGSSPDEVADEILDNIIAAGKQSGMVMAGVENAIHLLKSNGYKIGLASSSPMRMIDALVDHFAIKEHFDVITSADTSRYGKPHPGVFLECAEMLEVKPVDCLVLEDSLNGMIAGKAARMKVVVVPEPNHFEDPRFVLADARLRSLEDFDLNLVQSLS